jgi:hypothetical protein
MAEQFETRFKKKVKALLLKLPDSWWLIAQMLALVGIPDIIGVVNGRFVALELKKNRKEAEKTHGRVRLQGHILMLIRNAGGYAEFVYPENWDAIHADLSRLSEAKVPSPWA